MDWFTTTIVMLVIAGLIALAVFIACLLMMWRTTRRDRQHRHRRGMPPF